jgi:MtN3 and saliva related transmembrane protein
MWLTALGLLAAALTTAANIPQVVKCWRTRKADDISLAMIVTLGSGLALWTLYGALRGDLVVVIGNTVAFLIACALLALKLRFG